MKKEFDPVLPVIAKQGDSSDDHENKCERCGVGCHSTVNIDDRDIVVEGLHCKYLERVGDGPLENLGRGRFQCSVYEDRMELAPWCGHTHYARDKGWLRLGCPYATEVGVTDIGKERLSPEEYEKLWPRILYEVVMTNWQEYTSHQEFIENELSKRSPHKWVTVPGDVPGTIAFETGD